MASATSNVYHSQDGYIDLPKRVLYLTMAGLMLSLLLAALDQTVVGTAMPRIISELQGFNHYAWVTTAYMLTSTAVVPIVGKLSDLYGRKQFLVGGAIFFVLTSMLCGLAQDMTQLVLFRGLQGIGAGILMSTVFTVISSLFPPAERGKIQGIFGGVFGFASILGPLIGGYLTDYLSWRWVFYVNLPVGALAVAVLAAEFPNIKPHRDSRPKIDFLGSAALVACVTPLLLGLSWAGHEFPWGSPEIIGLLAFSVLMLAAFLLIEQRAAEPVIPLRLFHSRITTVAALGLGITSMGMFGSILYIPLFIQGVIGSSATSSGTLLAPMMATMLVSSIAGGQIISRTGRYKTMGVAGLCIMAFGMFLLSQMGPDTDYLTVIRNMMILGLGMGPTMPVFTLAAQNSVDLRELGVVTALTQFSRSIGGTVGAALFGSLLTNQFSPAITAAAGKAGLAVPARVMDHLQNPQALVDPHAADALKDALVASSPQGADLYAGLLLVIKQGLSSALHDTFLTASLLLVGGVLLMLLLKEAPLRRRQRTPQAATAPDAAPAAAETREPVPQR